MKYRGTVEERPFDIEVDHGRLVRVHGHPMYVVLEQVSGMPVHFLTLDDKGYVVFVEEGQGEYRVEVQAGVTPCGCQASWTSCRERGLIEQKVNPGPYPFPQLSGILDEGQQARRPIWTQVIPSVFYRATMPTTRPGESPPTLPISWQSSPT